MKCLFLGAIVIATPRATLAQPPPPHREHVRFSYSAPEDCPTREEFMANVHDRAAELIDDPEAARSLAVSIDHDDGWQGELRTEGIANGEGTRQIRGDSCASVAKSLAIFTAIALREGSPEELPPAHPELQKKDAPDPNEGFLPMAAPPKTTPLLPDLHRGRFALTVKESLGIVNDGGRTFGTGLDVDFYPARWVGLGVEGAVLLDLPHAYDDGDANEARARFLAHVEFLTVHAHGSMFGPHRGRVFDQLIDVGAGVIFTRPRREEIRPYEDYPYSLDFLFSIGTGFRFFLDDEIAFSLHADVMTYSQPNTALGVVTGQRPALGNDSIAIGPVFQLGLTWFPSRARTWDE